MTDEFPPSPRRRRPKPTKAAASKNPSTGKGKAPKPPKAETPAPAPDPAASKPKPPRLSPSVCREPRTAPKPAGERPPLPKGGATAILDAFGIAEICERLADGWLLTEIARDLEVGRVTLGDWLAADPDRSARAREARRIGAEAEDSKALQVLEEAKTDTSAHVAKAREIAQHRRWRSAKLDPSGYGDRVAVDATMNLQAMADGDLMGFTRSLLGLPPAFPDDADES